MVLITIKNQNQSIQKVYLAFDEVKTVKVQDQQRKCEMYPLYYSVQVHSRPVIWSSLHQISCVHVHVHVEE